MASADINVTLYNGNHEVVFKNGNHRYYVNGTAKWGVTTAIGKVIAKQGLMTWAMDMALKYIQTKLPVVTQADLDEAAQAYVKRRDHGADTGSIVHELAESLLLGKDYDVGQYPREVQLAMGAFETWVSASKPEVIAVEQVVYSERLDYCGTFDSILRIKGKVYLCDLKTTNASREAPEGVYGDYFIQLGAYLDAYNEQRIYEEAHGGSNLVPIDDVMIISCKKNGVLHTKSASDIGLSVDNCIDLWESVWHLAQSMDRVKKLLSK